MPVRLMSQKKTMGFKIEETPYTAETLTATDYDFSVYDITVSPEVEMYGRKLARGEYSQDVSVAGRRRCVVTCKVDMHSGASATTAPQYFQMLRACGLKQLSGGSGVWLLPDKEYDRVPATIEVCDTQGGTSPTQLVYKVKSAMGNATLTGDQVGQPARIEFTFTGVLDSISTRVNAQIITPTAFDTKLPPAVLAATVTYNGVTQSFRRFTIDLGSQVELFTDPSKAQGYDGARLVGRLPTMELDPDLYTPADEDTFSMLTSNTTAVFSITIGENLYIIAPAAQVVDTHKQADSEGHVTNQLKLELKRSSGSDEIKIRQGSE